MERTPKKKEYPALTHSFRCLKCDAVVQTMDELTEHNARTHGKNTPVTGQSGIDLQSRLPSHPAETE